MSRFRYLYSRRYWQHQFTSVSTVIPEYHSTAQSTICTASLINCFTSRHCNKSYRMRMMMMMSYKTNTDAIQSSSIGWTSPWAWAALGIKTHHIISSSPLRLLPSIRKQSFFSIPFSWGQGFLWILTKYNKICLFLQVLLKKKKKVIKIEFSRPIFLSKLSQSIKLLSKRLQKVCTSTFGYHYVATSLSASQILESFPLVWPDSSFILFGI